MSTTVSAQVKHTNYDELNQQVLKSVFGDFPSSKTSLGNSSSEYRCVMCTKNSRLTKLKAIVDSSVILMSKSRSPKFIHIKNIDSLNFRAIKCLFN